MLTIVINVTIIKQGIALKYRIFWITLSSVACLAGAFLYGLCRPSTYIGSFMATAFSLPLNTGGILYPFFAYYLPDYLWAFALAGALHAVFLPIKRGSIAIALLTSSYGILWELGQFHGVVKGTADPIDNILYVLAALTAVSINILWNKRRKRS